MPTIKPTHPRSLTGNSVTLGTHYFTSVYFLSVSNHNQKKYWNGNLGVIATAPLVHKSNNHSQSNKYNSYCWQL